MKTGTIKKTRAQKKREKLHESVASSFLELSPIFIGEKGYSAHQLFVAIADKHDLTEPGVRTILKRLGFFSSNYQIYEQYGGRKTKSEGDVEIQQP